jgi:hypothetical protein
VLALYSSYDGHHNVFSERTLYRSSGVATINNRTGTGRAGNFSMVPTLYQPATVSLVGLISFDDRERLARRFAIGLVKVLSSENSKQFCAISFRKLPSNLSVEQSR